MRSRVVAVKPEQREKMPLNAAELILARSMEPAIRVRPAIHFNGNVVTYAELHALINRAANAFLGLNIQRGERVPLLLADSPLYAACILGLMKIGAVPVPLNTRLEPGDYKHIAADCGARLLVHDTEFSGMLAELAGVKLLPAAGGADSLTRRMAAAAQHAEFAVLEAEDPCFWLYSSGTTGAPKGIVHSQRAAAESSKIMCEVLEIDETAVIFSTSKLFFAFALDNALLAVLRIGASSVLNEGWADPESVAAQVARIAPDVFLTVPSFLPDLLGLDEVQLAPFRECRYSIAGDEGVPEAVALKWHEVTGHELISWQDEPVEPAAAQPAADSAPA